GCVACARHLIAAKADPDLADPDGVTPMNMALLNLHFDFAAYMIEAGADLDKWDLFGRSPLYMAADVSTLPVKGNGAMAVIPSEDKNTALDVARLLLKKGALVDLPSKEGVTPLMAAAGVEFGTRVTRGRNRSDEGVLATMKLLLDAGANINAHMVTEPRRPAAEGANARANAAAGRG